MTTPEIEATGTGEQDQRPSGKAAAGTGSGQGATPGQGAGAAAGAPTERSDARSASDVAPGAAPARRVLITGAAGYVGDLVVRALERERGGVEVIVATDLREVAPAHRLDDITYETLDIRSGDLAERLAEHDIDTVVHLAAMVTPPPGMGREVLYDIDVEGTRNVLDACLEAGVRRFVYTSSGAAYGYHPDNQPLLTEDDPLRGNEEFPYAWHKRLVEELLARYREQHPELAQLVFRVSTILGRTTSNQITAMWERPVVLGLREAETPFCFAWDGDVAGAIVQGLHTTARGVYNLTGDGVMTLREIAKEMGRPYVELPERVVRKGLSVLGRLDLSSYGPEQTMFLLHRPVLSAERLKTGFGYRPKTTREAFAIYQEGRV